MPSLLHFVGRGDLNEARRLLEARPDLVNATGPHPFWGGQPQALHVAIETGRREMFDLLIGAGADVNGSNEKYDHWSPLMLAIHRGHDDMRDELVRRGARVGLVEALMLGDDARVDEVLDRDVSFGVVPNGGSILMFARTVHAIDRLVALGVSVDEKDRWQSTPVQALSRLGPKAKRLVDRLVAHGAQISAADRARIADQSALAAMLETDRAQVISDEVLLASVDTRNTSLTKWLLGAGADANARASAQSRQTALHSAAWNGDLEMVRILVDAGADISARDEEHRNTPRGWAETAITVRNDPRCKDVADYLAARER